MKYSLFGLLILFGFNGLAQVKLTLPEAEQQLQKNNLNLLAEQYNISAAQAGEIQARIWEHPFLSVDLNAINPQNKRVLEVGRQGQKGLAIQQLLYLGGKKKKELAVAKSNTEVARLQYEQLLRDLRYQLGQTFYAQYFDQKKLATLDQQIVILDELLNNYNIQAQKGNVPLKDEARLRRWYWA